jgi:hypothetical protein
MKHLNFVHLPEAVVLFDDARYFAVKANGKTIRPKNKSKTE